MKKMDGNHIKRPTDLQANDKSQNSREWYLDSTTNLSNYKKLTRNPPVTNLKEIQGMFQGRESGQG